jgi:ubiquinone/menaquinone biosynthesis C-methylase UbiE
MKPQHKHVFPERFAFLLNNPIRRHFANPKKLISELGISSQDVVLDFGCGTGYFTIPLSRTAQKVIGVDISGNMLKKTAEYARREGVVVELLQSDGTRIDLSEDCVDVIMLVHVLHHVEEKARTLLEFHRILKPGGRVVILEKTRGGFLTGIIGPPKVDQNEVITDLKSARLLFATTRPYGNETIIEAKKPSP